MINGFEDIIRTIMVNSNDIGGVNMLREIINFSLQDVEVRTKCDDNLKMAVPINPNFDTVGIENDNGTQLLISCKEDVPQSRNMLVPDNSEKFISNTLKNDFF